MGIAPSSETSGIQVTHAESGGCELSAPLDLMDFSQRKVISGAPETPRPHSLIREEPRDPAASDGVPR